MKLLVTGFPKFDAFPENSTQALIESMIEDPTPGIAALGGDVVFEIIQFENDDASTQQATMLESLHRALDNHAPDACLFCGQAASRPLVELEAIAINVFKGEIIDPDGPPAYWATLANLKELVESLRAAGIPARLSHHAGTHLCNHILYTALRQAEMSGRGMRCGFLHLPMTSTQVIEGDENRPFIPLSMTREALTMAIRHAIEPAPGIAKL
jgi:pyroglutamyl-peptidase